MIGAIATIIAVTPALAYGLWAVHLGYLHAKAAVYRVVADALSANIWGK